MFKAEAKNIDHAKEQKVQLRKEIISLIHENIKRYLSGQELDQELVKKDVVGKDILAVLNHLKNSRPVDIKKTPVDVISFLKDYEETTRYVPLDKLPDLKKLNSLWSEKKHSPFLVELGMAMDELKVKFKHDFVKDVLRRDFLEKEMSHYGARMKEFEMDQFSYSHGLDDTHGLLYQKGVVVKEFANIKPADKKAIETTKFQFEGIAGALNLEIMRLTNRLDEYQNLESKTYAKYWQQLEKLNNEIAKAIQEKQTPIDFFDVKNLSFLKKLFSHHLKQLEEKEESRAELESEYVKKYFV